MENKKDIVARLKLLLIATRAGSNIEALLLSDDECFVTIQFKTGVSRVVNIEADSGIAIIRDVIAKL